MKKDELLNDSRAENQFCCFFVKQGKKKCWMKKMTGVTFFHPISDGGKCCFAREDDKI